MRHPESACVADPRRQHVLHFGFTRVDLLVVVAILGLLVALLLPTLQAARESGRDTQSKSNLRQLGLAVHSVQLAFGRTPPMFGHMTTTGQASRPPGSMYYHLLPHLQEQALYDRGPDLARSQPLVVLQHPGDTSLGSGVYELTTDVPPWAGPSDRWGLSSYAANWQIFGDRGADLSKAIKDGTSKTVMLAEKYATASRPTGSPAKGATLWGYGIVPPEEQFAGNYWVESLLPGTVPTGHLYIAPYWPRIGFVNWNGPVAWDTADTWRLRCHKRPEFKPAIDNAHPLKAQAFSSTGINVCLADGSVATISSGIDDENWYYWTTPADLDTPRLE